MSVETASFGRPPDVTVDSADALVRRVGPTLRVDLQRTILRPFLPGAELVSVGLSRADAVVGRVLDLSEEEVAAALPPLVRALSARHPAVRTVFQQHADESVGERVGRLSRQRRELLGAYLTQEYAVEAAALFNPSIVPHPDQTGLAAEELRFVLTLRAVGEGHISSLELRTGVVSAAGDVRVDHPGQVLVRPAVTRDEPTERYRRQVRGAARADLDAPDSIDPDETLDAAVEEQVQVALESRYTAEFAPDSSLGERVLFPVSAAERGGIEDVRFLPFLAGPGSVPEFRGTYTAYDGRVVRSHLLTTTDFRTFHASRLFGTAARDKGMAMFPRPVGGRLLSMARRDRETLVVAASDEGMRWDDVGAVQRPRRAWELIQLGTGAPPLETPEGWLVITHGVGPVREYALGAMLLDLADPRVVRGVLAEPLLVPTEEERIGYVPNVVYTCGALLHAGLVVLPYGCSDSSVRFATVPLDPLLDRLRPP